MDAASRPAAAKLVQDSSRNAPSADWFPASDPADRSLTRIVGLQSVCFALVFAAAIWNIVDINSQFESGEDHVGLDAPVLLKLAIAGACWIVGLWGVILSPQVRRTLISIPGSVLVTLGLVFVATSAVAYEPSANISRVAAVINLGYVLFVAVSLSAIGLKRFAIACLIAMIGNLLANWALYLFVPTIGVFEEELGRGTMISRMGALGHPNAIARIGMFSGLISLWLLMTSPSVWNRNRLVQTFHLMVIGLAIATLFATASRTAYAATLCAVAALLIDRFASRWGVTLVFLGVTVCASAFLVLGFAGGADSLGETLVSATTKTGDLSELTTATGRTEIWAEAVRLISNRPLVGWGLNSSPLLMPDHSMHTHNLLLHATFSGGLLAGVLVCGLLIWSLTIGAFSGEPLVRAVSIALVVSGLFEDAALDTFASPSTLLWFMVLLYPAHLAWSRRSAHVLGAVRHRK